MSGPTIFIELSDLWIPDYRFLNPFPKSLTQFQMRVITTWFSTMILQNTINFVLYFHLFTTLNSIVALMYYQLHIHKLCRSKTHTTLVSEITDIISCHAPTTQAVVFVTYYRYLLRSDGILNRVWVPG